MLQTHLLSVLVWLPIVGGIAVMLAGERAAKGLSLGVALLTFALSIPLWTGFELGTASFQFVERVAWIPSLHSDYYLGVDGISLPLIVLTTFTTVLVIVAGFGSVTKR